MADAGIIDLELVELMEGHLFSKRNGVRWRFSVAEFYAMTEVAGIIPEDSSTELMGGEVILAARISPRHAACRSELIRRLFKLRNERLVVAPVNPIRLDAYNELIPDVALLHSGDADYQSAHPGPKDVALLIEVCDADYDFDRQHKLAIYAWYGVAEVWLFNLPGRCVEIYDEPGAGGYARMRVVGIDGVLAPGALPYVGIPVREVMPD